MTAISAATTISHHLTAPGCGASCAELAVIEPVLAGLKRRA
jgi:hypothetical protein